MSALEHASERDVWPYLPNVRTCRVAVPCAFHFRDSPSPYAVGTMEQTRARDQAGNTVYQPFTPPGDGQTLASDALLIGELDTLYLSADSKESNLRRGEKLAISTPNADYLPHVNLGNQVISMCTDGRWGAEDWGQWPQWYFDGPEHFAYVLRKPAPSDLTTHPLRRLWWNTSEFDFRLDGVSKNWGMLLPSIIEEFKEIRTSLMKEVDACVCRKGVVYSKLQECACKMRHCVSALLSPQPYTGTLLTTVNAQRYCLETRAMLDMIAGSIPSPSSNGHPPADNTRLGCITDRVPVVCELLEKGIPVWYVRPSSEVSLSTTIVMQAPITRPAQRGIETKRWQGAPIFYQGPLCRDIHAGIESWKPGNLDFNLLRQGPGLGLTNDGGLRAQRKSGGLKGCRSQPYPKKPVNTRVKKPNISVNLDLFKNDDAPYLPKVLHSWNRVLAEVITETTRVIDHPNSNLFRGYAFPPRSIFSGGDEEKNLEYMLAWLVIRSSWMATLGTMESRFSPLPNAQQWRFYLRQVALELELVRVDNRKLALTAPCANVSQSTRRGGRLKEAAKNIFTMVLPSKKDVQKLMWNDNVVWRSMHELSFSVIDRQQLVWDTEERNFRAELTSLDHLIMASMWGSGEGSKIRTRKLSAMWPGGFDSSLALPCVPGISAEDWMKRCLYVEAFQSILMDWPGEVPRLLSRSSVTSEVAGRECWDRLKMEKVERLAAGHYCQTFFDHFGRAPCIPRIFPM